MKSTKLPRRILVVDDYRDATDSLVMILQTLGHRARAAYDGQSALLISAQFHPEVVLLETCMSGMNGYEMAKRMRDQAINPPLAFVAISGRARPEDVSRSQEAGFDGHLVKPMDYELFEQALARCERVFATHQSTTAGKDGRASGEL